MYDWKWSGYYLLKLKYFVNGKTTSYMYVWNIVKRNASRYMYSRLTSLKSTDNSTNTYGTRQNIVCIVYIGQSHMLQVSSSWVLHKSKRWDLSNILTLDTLVCNSVLQRVLYTTNHVCCYPTISLKNKFMIKNISSTFNEEESDLEKRLWNESVIIQYDTLLQSS